MRQDSGTTGSGAGARRVPTLAGDAGAWLSTLAQIETSEFDEKGALDAITALEHLKHATAAAQARLAVQVDQQARARQQTAGVPREKLGAGVGAQIALARLESPHRGGRHLGLAKTLVTELPHTLTAMTRGQVSEWRATLVARETACLDPDVRRDIDHHIADDLPRWGDRETERHVRALTYQADPGAAVRRHAQAVTDRHVTLRPAPDTMCYLTALLPVTQGVATYAALTREADRIRATGDPEGRGKGQVMADTLVERLTGQTTAPDVPVEIDLVMGLDTLLGHSQRPAHLAGYGPLPAPIARNLVRDTEAQAWLRRLFTQPDTGRIVAMDSHRQLFQGQLRHLVILRDQFCRTPWCDAPIRHTDHPQPRRQAGPTHEDNAQGLCEACNYTKEAPGWQAHPTPTNRRHQVTITTPTGQRYTTEAPQPP